MRWLILLASWGWCPGRQRPVKFFREWADTWGPEMFCDPGLTAARRGIYNGSSYQEHRGSPHLQCHCHHDCQDASPADGQRRCPRWFDQQEMLWNGLSPAAFPVLTSSVPSPTAPFGFCTPFFPYTHIPLFFGPLPHFLYCCQNHMGWGLGLDGQIPPPTHTPSCVCLGKNCFWVSFLFYFFVLFFFFFFYFN